MPRTALLKSQKVTESQRLTRYGDTGFVLESTIRTLNAPYGRDFEADVMYTVHRGWGDGDEGDGPGEEFASERSNLGAGSMLLPVVPPRLACSLTVSSRVRFVGPNHVNAFVQSQIRSHVRRGTKEGGGVLVDDDQYT